MYCEIKGDMAKGVRQVWRFLLFTNYGADSLLILLDNWKVESLPTPRSRKWLITEWWSRIDNRNNVTKHHPPIPNTVLKLVSDFYTDKIQDAINKIKVK